MAGNGERPQLDGPKWPNLGNVVWFALGMIVMGVIGTAAFDSWLHAQIEAQVDSPETVQYLIKQDAFRAPVANLTRDLSEKIDGINNRLDHATLVAEPLGLSDPYNNKSWGCGDHISAPANSLYVMNGIGFSLNHCASGELDFEHLKLDIPK